jgi:L-fuconolactonase
MLTKIDAHQHFWHPARRDYGWLEALEGEAARRLQRPILPAELEPVLAHHGIDQTVLVQAAPTEAEGDFLLALAEQHAFIAGAVVWMDMESAEFESRLAQRRQHPKFVGVRPMIQDIADPRWMLQPSVKRAFGALSEQGVCFDFLIKPQQLEPTLQILAEFPRLRAVVDHIAKPDIRGRQLEPWRSLMQRVASHENVFCKLSGMVTEADHDGWTAADLAPYVAEAVRFFGPDRLMFGSDWPVCTLAASYAQVLAALESVLAPLRLSEANLARIFGGTAWEFYRLREEPRSRGI